MDAIYEKQLKGMKRRRRHRRIRRFFLFIFFFWPLLLGLAVLYRMGLLNWNFVSRGVDLARRGILWVYHNAGFIRDGVAGLLNYIANYL
ncbi:MAG: hypothetical protein Q4E76_05200 [Tissierellia bacterium]|nr:hypothetical protein [Tissierellia bacterium]